MCKFVRHAIVLLSLVLQISICAAKKDMKPEGVVVNGIWLQPSEDGNANPVWGFAEGIKIGIAPMPGPRGLIRIYTPHIGYSEMYLLNYMAIEPIVEGTPYRGFSELEFSKLDGTNGKRFWSSDTPFSSVSADLPLPARGIISNEEGCETLTVYIFSEAFDNGAKVYLKIRFRADNPYEFEVSTFAREDSAPLTNCIVTATMGNHARLRTLFLRGGTKTSHDIWPDYTGSDFTAHDFTPAGEFITGSDGRRYFIACGDEKEPWNAEYHPTTASHWKYCGDKIATQYWAAADPDISLVGCVNGRFCYWASKSPITGGISFENFELIERYKEGRTFAFGIIPVSPLKFIEQITTE